MDFFDFKKMAPTNFPDGAYLIVLAGSTPVDGVILSQLKVVVGWPNPILTTLQGLQDPPRDLLEAVHKFLQGPFNKSLFNMAVYEVNNNLRMAAIFGLLPPDLQINDAFSTIFHHIETHMIIK